MVERYLKRNRLTIKGNQMLDLIGKVHKLDVSIIKSEFESLSLSVDGYATPKDIDFCLSKHKTDNTTSAILHVLKEGFDIQDSIEEIENYVSRLLSNKNSFIIFDDIVNNKYLNRSRFSIGVYEDMEIFNISEFDVNKEILIHCNEFLLGNNFVINGIESVTDREVINEYLSDRNLW